jgi:hypothetical protein
MSTSLPKVEAFLSALSEQSFFKDENKRFEIDNLGRGADTFLGDVSNSIAGGQVLRFWSTIGRWQKDAATSLSGKPVNT